MLSSTVATHSIFNPDNVAFSALISFASRIDQSSFILRVLMFAVVMFPVSTSVVFATIFSVEISSFTTIFLKTTSLFLQFRSQKSHSMIVPLDIVNLYLPSKAASSICPSGVRVVIGSTFTNLTSSY